MIKNRNFLYFWLLVPIIFLSCGNSKLSEGINKADTLSELEHWSKMKIESDLSQKDRANYIKIESFLPHGYSKKGDVDYTYIIQKVLDDYRKVEFPDFTLLINDGGITVRSNSRIYFNENSLLKLAPTDKKIFSVIFISDVQNVIMYSPKIEGDRFRRLNPHDKSGEWGMGIWIQSSNNISIYNPEVSSCWGDGIYFGRGKQAIPNNNILIHQAILDKNRRNGMSITNGKNIAIIEPIVTNTYGTSPEAGIDIEPNTNLDEIDNILIKDPYTYKSGEYGMLIILGLMIGESNKKVNIKIVNHIDENSSIGFRVGGLHANRMHFKNRLEGNIKVINPIWKNNLKPFIMEDTREMFPIIEFTNCKVYKSIGNQIKLDSNFITEVKSKFNFKGILFN